MISVDRDLNSPGFSRAQPPSEGVKIQNREKHRDLDY